MIKYTIFFILLFKISLSFSQSKKDQIENMILKLDSLSQVIVAQDQNIGNLNELIFLKERYIDSTKNYASHLNQEYRDFEERATKKKQEYEIVLKDLNEKNIGLQDSLSLIAESIKKIDSIKIANLSKVIPTIKIGNQEWMTSDINTTIYYNGDPIIEAKTSQQWKACNDKKEGCYRRLSNGTYVYNGYAISDKRGIVPSGFIIPKDEQFTQLFKLLGGGLSNAGKATLSMATYIIDIGDIDEVMIKSNGSSGFNAVQGGFVYDHGVNNDNGWDNCNYWWTSSTEKTDENITVNIVVDIGYCSQDIGGGVGSYPWGYGFAVRACKAGQSSMHNESLENNKNYKNLDGNFSIAFPSTPTVTKEVVPSEAADITMNICMYEASNNKGKIQVLNATFVYSDYPKGIFSKGNSIEILDGAKNGALSTFGKCTVEEEAKINKDGNSGIYFKAKAATNYHLVYNLYLVGNRLYQVGLLQDKVYPSQSEIDNYFSSFNFLTK